jgi:chromosome segregation ATPase
VEAASDLAEAAGIGLPQGGSERMAETLRAAMVNPAIAHQLRGGVLEKDASAPGLGLEGMTASIPTKKAHSEADEARTDRGEREGLRAQVEQELRDAQARHAEARAKADEAEREAEGLRRVADAVKDEVDNLSRRLADLGN